ncbi:hypothetical protein [Xenorhabdus sp. SGI246]
MKYEVVTSGNGSILDDQKAVFQENWYNIRVPTTGMLKTIWENKDNWE